MPFEPTRRDFLSAVAAAGLPLGVKESPKLKAIAFDAFVLFDPAEISSRAKAVAGDRAAQLVSAMSAKLFGYTWLYTSATRYAPFDILADEALAFAAKASNMSLTAADRQHILGAYSGLAAWPDVKVGLEELQDRGVRLALLSNMTEAALRANVSRNGLHGYLDLVLSTDLVGRYKPAPKAYQLGVDALKMPKGRIGFAASAAWDAAGAAWYGYPSVWINRLQAPLELTAQDVPIERDMQGVLRLVG